MKRRIHSFGNDLLGSVLMRLLSAWRLSEKLDAELTCYWPEETAQRSGFRFGELFEGDPPFTLSDQYPDFHRLPRLDEAVEGLTIDLAKLAPEFVYSSTGIRLLPGEDLEVARQEARALFSRLKLLPQIVDAIAEIDSAVPLKDAMAVHVRRGSDIVPRLLLGDLPPGIENGHTRGYARMFVDLESYRRAIKDLGSPKCFVFCADDADRAQLKRDIDGYSVDEFRSIQRLAPLQRDLAEILVMSRTGRLLGPKSNYSGLARLLGDLHLQWIARWIVPEEMVAMVKRDFAGRPDLQARIIGASAEFYARAAPAASAHFAEVARAINAELSSDAPLSQGLSA
jgi:hypothetical protein